MDALLGQEELLTCALLCGFFETKNELARQSELRQFFDMETGSETIQMSGQAWTTCGE
jgi:hypothetical protein